MTTPRAMSGQGRDWFITINNPSEQEIQAIKDSDHTFCAIGREIGHKSGQPHIHCLIQFTQRLRFARIKNMFPRADIQQRRGTVKEALAYVIKEDKEAWITGNISQQGERTDLKSVISECKTLKELRQEHPAKYCMYRNGLKDIYTEKQIKESIFWKPKVYWMSGPTGCGKTRSAIEWFGKQACMLHCCKDMWFDEWDDNCTVCILDELRHDSIQYTTLLAMLSWNIGMKLKIKGGFTFFHPKVIIITSPEPAEQEFSYRDKDDCKTLRSDFSQLKRRIDVNVNWDDRFKRWVRQDTVQEKFEFTPFEFDSKKQQDKVDLLE